MDGSTSMQLFRPFSRRFSNSSRGIAGWYFFLSKKDVFHFVIRMVLGGGFKYLLFSPLLILGERIQFDRFFQIG